MEYKINWDGNNPIIRFTGEVNFDIIHQIGSEILTDDRFEFATYQIDDFSDATFNNLDIKDLRAIFTVDSAASLINDSLKIAIVLENVSAELIENALETAGIYAELMKDSSWSVNIFQAYSEAEKWCKE